MLTNKKKLTASLAAISLLVLAGCSEDEMRYPSNYKDTIVSTIKNDNNEEVPTAQDTFKKYFQSLTNDDAVYEKAVKKVLTTLADNVHGMLDTTESTPRLATYAAVNDQNKYVSVADQYYINGAKNEIYNVSSNKTSNLEARAKDNFVSTAKGGSYEEDNEWDESKYAKYLAENYYYLSNDVLAEGYDGETSLEKNATVQKLVTSSMEYDDLYSAANADAYNTYMQKELFDDMKVNYLTAEYIYNKSYASIGNSNARKVQVIAIADRSDETGDAQKLMDAYVKDYIQDKNSSLLGTDKDFSILSKLWKGLTVESLVRLVGSDNDGKAYLTITRKADNSAYDVAWNVGLPAEKKTETKKLFARYGVTLGDDTLTIDSLSEVLTPAQEAWLEKYDIIDAQNGEYISGTLVGKVLEDAEKLVEGKNNWHKLDSSLESTYTGSYSYETSTGLRKAVDDLVVRDLTTEGTYLKSAGISSLPSALTDRIFSTRVSARTSVVNTLKNNPGVKGDDLTIYENDGNRYVTVADTISTDDNNIVYYDASSKTYYLTRILDVVDTAAIANPTEDSTASIYTKAEQKQQIAWEVAYAMATTGSYKSDAGVYWLSRLNFEYFDDSFLEYMKSNYKDVFKTENPYASATKIDLASIWEA